MTQAWTQRHRNIAPSFAYSPSYYALMSESVPLSLASRLNSRRREIGMSGGELARKTGLSRSHVNALLSGKRSPTPSISEDLTRVLELDDVLAQELRSLDESVYKSGFASGPIRLTKAEKANE